MIQMSAHLESSGPRREACSGGRAFRSPDGGSIAENRGFV